MLNYQHSLFPNEDTRGWHGSVFSRQKCGCVSRKPKGILGKPTFPFCHLVLKMIEVFFHRNLSEFLIFSPWSSSSDLSVAGLS